MWSKPETSKGKTAESHLLNMDEKPNTSAVHRKTGIPPSKINSLVCADYNDFDDDSHTPPQTPPTSTELKQTPSLPDNGPLQLGSPSDKLEPIPDTIDYDDDKTIVNTEVTLSSAAQRDNDDITVIEQFGDTELVDVMSGALDGDMQEEYVLFEPGVVVDLSADSNDSLCHALVNDGSQGHDLVQILEIENPESQTDEPMLSDEDLAPSHTRNKKGLRLDIVRTLESGKRLLAVTDTPESPDQDELRVDPSPGPYMDHSPDQDLMVSLDSESEVVIIDPSTKSPEDNFFKESCDDENDKVDPTNNLDVSKDHLMKESSNDDQSESQKETKQTKSPTAFTFPETVTYSQIPPSNLHQTNIDLPVSCLSTIIFTTCTTTETNAITASTTVVTSDTSAKSSTTFPTVCVTKEPITSSPSSQRQTTSSSSMTSIVADAKIAAKLNQAVLENISITSQQAKPESNTLRTITVNDTIVSTTYIIKEKISISTPTTQLECKSFVQNVNVNTTEATNNPTKLLLSVQPTSVTLSKPKMDTGKGKSGEKDETDHTEKNQEKDNLVSKVDINSTLIQETIISDDKKSDPLNTTDELESMLEAIHNPAENNTTEKKNAHPDEKSNVSTLKRMSPVSDHLSLIPFLYRIHCLNEERNLMEESSDDILDMLHNIISSKPEMMANTDILNEDRSRKSSLIYQLPTPLDTLPLNILQDSLLDLEQENLENEQLLSSESKMSPKPQKTSPSPTGSMSKKSPPHHTLPLVVSTVAQLQKCTTTVPHLSPLSKPTELTSNVANVSHQLRTLLSSLQTNHSQNCTTSQQPTIVTMVSSVISAPKVGTILSTSTSSPNSVNNTQPNSNLRLQTCMTPCSHANTIKADNESTTATYTSQGKESTNSTVSVISSHCKVTTSEQFLRVTSSGIQSQPTNCLTLQTSSVVTPRQPTNTGISITSNAMLNAMLAGTNSAKSTIAGHRANTVPTQVSNLLSSAMPSPSVQRTQTLQASSNSSSSITSRISANSTSTAISTSMQCIRTIVPPTVTSNTSNVNVTTSILQSTLSQTPTPLQAQHSSGQSSYKTAGLLPIDNKNNELEGLGKISAVKKEQDETSSKLQMSNEKTPTTRNELETGKGNLTTNSHRMEESQNVLLKQLLQNTACPALPPASASTSQGPSLPSVPSLEAQLATPVQPPLSYRIPPIVNETPTIKSPANKQVLARETSFLSHTVNPLKVQSPPTKEDPPKPPPPPPPPPPPSPLATSTPTLTQQRPVDIMVKQQTTNQTSKVASTTTQANQQLTLIPAVKQVAPVSTKNCEVLSSLQQDSNTSQPQIKISNDPAITSTAQVQQQRAPTPMIVSRMISQTKPISTTVPVKMTQAMSQASNNATQQVPTVTPPQALHSQPLLPVTQKTIAASQQSTHISPVQPSVPHTVPHTMGHQSQMSQGANAQHSVPLVEVKKEILDEVLSSGTPTQLTDTKDFLTAKEELMDCSMDDKTDLKKLRRRQYQQKRKQSQGKDALTVPQKKRCKKVSRLDEDYDTFVDNFMIQLRQLPPMAVLEPLLGSNYGVCPIFGSGDLSKIVNQKDYNTRTGDLIGSYGSANLPGVSDHYNTQPFGELEPLPPQQPVSTQRGFYDQEFPPLKLDDAEEKKENSLVANRDIDSPDTIISSSSPECVIPEFVPHFPGLRLIEEESDEESDWLKRVSPVIPLVSPIPIRLKPTHIRDTTKQDKENLGIPRLGKSPPTPLRENGNVTVTLTLNSQAADDIMGVLKDLANILNIAPPTGYQIVERTTTPPSQKLGLYRTKGKDGKEGAPVDIQTILNGAAKFCRHCDVVILNSLIRKKVSDLPFLSKEEAEPGDELCFCSAGCYVQFALIHRTPTSTQDKAATIVDHLCPKVDPKIIDDDFKKLQEKRFSIKQSIDHSESMAVDFENKSEIRIKIEEEFEIHDNREDLTEEKRPKKHAALKELSGETNEPPPPAKLWKGLRYKTWTMGAIQPPTKYKKPTDKEITDMLFRMGVTVVPAKAEDSRRCMFCQSQGDGTADGPARLLNFDVDKWVHLNCALWSDDVYETVNGALMNLDPALQHSLVLNCIICEKPGATVKCFKTRCTNFYHLGCAVKDGCVFYKNKSTFCSQHVQKNEKDNELTTLSVFRRVYVNRDENRQVAAVMHHSEHNHLLRVGSLIFLSVGQLLPHQLANFHTPNHIYPVGYKIVRFYWSMRRPNKRCRYVCSIHDVSGRPEFRVLVQEPFQEDVELRDATPRAVWSRILEPLAELRKSTNSVKLFPRYVTGEDLFGLTEPAVVRVLESLPGIETLTDYRFKYGRNPLLELPLAINPTGSARTEARLRNQLPWKRPHTQRTGSSARANFVPTVGTVAGEVACPYSKQFVHSKSSQYKKMKQEWRNNVYLARSKIQGLGLYATRDLERHTMVIEYIGEIIRTELAETREKKYEAKNRGIYMFRLDEERVVDATLCGGLARYINHSCNPNCVAEIVEVERDLRIIIFAKRRISRGEELAYDYKFDIEDDQHKIACACGAPNCRKWMN
ncbi:hypothetical protein M0802_007109 [Mischocyttarus mexicanus]|nr:hypothetical protein M0802_007109 [Mischocyttarus mexicanus]